MKKNLLMLIVLFLQLNCKKTEEISNVENKKMDSLTVNSVKSKCDIPTEIQKYLSSNDEYELLTEKDLKLIKEYINSSICPTYIKGDFNFNGKEDVAVVVRYKGYKHKSYPNYNFPFLIIFNDYNDGIKPNIVYKTGDYENESEKSVIYDQFTDGIFSYIKSGKVCDKEVINIVIPEKSTFFVYWNQNKSKYEFLNHLDDDLCEKISNKEKNAEFTEIKDLFNQFKFEYLIKEIKSEENSKYLIKINLTNKVSNKIQNIDYEPLGLFSGKNNLDTSVNNYFDTKEAKIKTTEGLETFHNIIVLDVNFDGLEDFAIINFEGGNGGPLYAYYIQNPNNEFELDDELTNEVRFFPIEINNKEKTLTFGHPSGCCKINTFKIQIQPNGNWKQIYSKLEDIK